jgi:hypothetical protein
LLMKLLRKSNRHSYALIFVQVSHLPSMYYVCNTVSRYVILVERFAFKLFHGVCNTPVPALRKIPSLWSGTFVA